MGRSRVRLSQESRANNSFDSVNILTASQDLQEKVTQFLTAQDIIQYSL